VMKIFWLFYMCHFAMGLTHCYKTTVFLHLSHLKSLRAMSIASLLITEEDETEKLSDVCSV